MISSQEHAEGVHGEDEAAARRRNGERRVTELMSWALLTAPTTMTCSEALGLAAARGVHHIPVLDGGVMVGIVCTCDLSEAPADAPIGSYLCAPVATMRRHDVGALPVLYHGFLIGIVTAGDLVRAHVLAEEDRPTCAECGAHHHVRTPGADDDLGLDETDGDDRPLCIVCADRARR
jgi:CBS domain-containing protein